MGEFEILAGNMETMCLSPVWLILCVFKLYFHPNIFPQWLQNRNVFFGSLVCYSVWGIREIHRKHLLMCLHMWGIKCLSVSKDFPHASHEKYLQNVLCVKTCSKEYNIEYIFHVTNVENVWNALEAGQYKLVIQKRFFRKWFDMASLQHILRSCLISKQI